MKKSMIIFSFSIALLFLGCKSNKEKYSLEEGIDLLDQIGENILVYIEVDTKDYTLEN